jgi:DHA1 family bicyclomycin/chloramphenicol resistance-like MFS transporter
VLLSSLHSEERQGALHIFEAERNYPMRIPPHSRFYMLFLGSLATLPPLSIDMALPALTRIGHTLHTSPGTAGLSLSLFMAGFAISPLIYGPLADRYGRRPLLLFGLVLYAVSGVASMFAPSIGVLLGARLVQGAGAGAGLTLAFAAVRDLFEGPAAGVRLAMITIVQNTAPIVAPALGAALLAFLGWRGIYGVMAVGGVLLFAMVWFGFDETLKPLSAGTKHPNPIRDYGRVLCHRETVSYIAIMGLGFSWMFSYVAGSPLVLIEVLHASPALYSALFACTGAGIVAGAALNGRLMQRGVSSGALLICGIGTAVVATILLAILSGMGGLTLATIMPLLVLSTTGFGLMAPSAAHEALVPMPQYAGIIGGLLTSAQMLLAALASSVVSLLFPRLGTLAMTATMATLATLALLVLAQLHWSRRASMAREACDAERV